MIHYILTVVAIKNAIVAFFLEIKGKRYLRSSRRWIVFNDRVNCSYKIVTVLRLTA